MIPEPPAGHHGVAGAGEFRSHLALRSHVKAWEATQMGRFKNEIVGIEGHDANGFRVLCEVDEVVRADASCEALPAQSLPDTMEQSRFR